ncbi:MAG: glutamate mutase L [Oscillospiraceae bacterium]|nr:glutamate mutase L [Oscillospiraceae bacterium]
MKAFLLIDFGSTYTKLTAVDMDSERLLGTAAAYTTVQTDINDGLKAGLALLEQKIGKLPFEECYACSSAAGGLRMITSGLVPELTGEAAKLASLGAGAKVVGVYAFQLTEDDMEDIRAAKPDIFLLVGGTDGGNTECILHNAKMLAALPADFPVVIAGNRTAARECQRILAGHEVYICPNVMPKFGVLQIEPTQKQIREIFLNRIIQAKGLSKAAKLLSDIMMPTPSAVLQAMELLAQGCEGEPGIGDLVAVDVGGATTDVYSVADGMPEHMNTVYKGLPEPYAKRTVEGDIGMRYSIQGIVDAAGLERISRLSGLPASRVAELVEDLKQHTDKVPKGDDELEKLDFALASLAIEEAVKRHAGTMEETYTMMGQTFVQEGKDLTGVKQIVVTGGSLIHTKRTEEIAAHALYSPMQPASLRPKAADVWVDRTYILAAMGLLATHYPQTALRIMKKELEYHGYSEQTDLR